MSESLVTKLFVQFVSECRPGGRITPAHLAAFLENPDGILPVGSRFSEKFIGLLPPNAEVKPFACSLFEGRLLGIASDDKGQFVVWGERQGRRFNRVHRSGHNGVMTAEGKPLYIATDGSMQFVVWGDEVRGGYEGVAELSDGVTELTVADGKPLYCAKHNGKQFVVWNQTECKAYDRVGGLLIFDAQPLYIAKEDGKKFVVQGKHEGKRYDEIDDLRVADGKILYYARIGDQDYVVWGDKEIACGHIQREWGHWLQVAQEKPVYLVTQGEESFVVWGETEGKRYETIWGGVYIKNDMPIYIACKDSETFLVHGDTEIVKGRVIFLEGPYTIATDGQPVCCTIDCESGELSMVHGDRLYSLAAAQDSTWDTNDVTQIGFTDGQPFCIVQCRKSTYDGHTQVHESKAAVVHKGTCGEYFREITMWPNPIGNKPAYVGRRDGESRVVHGTETSEAYDYVHYFDRDNTDFLLAVDDQLVYAAGQDDKEFVVCGTVVSRRYDQVFDLKVEEGRVVFGAIRGRKVFEVSMPRTKQSP